MRADEVRGIGELLRLTVRGSTTRVAELHRGIADRAFGAVGPRAAPGKAVHGAVAGLDAGARPAYGGVRLALGAGARLGGALSSLGASGAGLEEDRAGGVALAILNG